MEQEKLFCLIIDKEKRFSFHHTVDPEKLSCFHPRSGEPLQFSSWSRENFLNWITEQEKLFTFLVSS